MAIYVANNGQLQTVKGIYYGMSEDYINATLFHNRVPTTATEIKFLYASNNPDLSGYQKLGYCDNNNFIEVWNSGTKYIIINPRKNYIYAPVSCFQFLYNYTALSVCIFDNFNTQNVTRMTSMFERCSNLISLDLTGFDTHNCSTMSSMFRFCQNLLSLDLRSFDTAIVTNMSAMFAQCNNLTHLNLSSFNTKNVTNFSSFLNRIYNIETLDLSSFNTAACQNFNSMFERTNIKTIISNTFDITSKLSDSNMFYQSSSLVGGNGTTYNSSHTTAEYARVDGENGLAGYFTAPTN